MVVSNHTKAGPDVSPGGSTLDDSIGSAYEQEAPVWSYEGRTGPEYWADLNPDYAICRSGRQQSPIDIVSSRPAERKELSFGYQPISPIRMVSTRQSIHVMGVPSCGITIGDVWYELAELHFHTPSEHRIDGALAAMELHLAHQTSARDVAVVGILIDEGTHNEPLGLLFDNLPQEEGLDFVLGGEIDPMAFLPDDRSWYHYTGSRTMPPCQEGVDWFILQHRIELSAGQIGAFRQRFEMNARPLQPVNGRAVSEYSLEGLRADGS
jgi:carbonic anhydrase